MFVPSGFRFFSSIKESLIVGLIKGGVVFSFKKRQGRTVEIVFDAKPIRLADALNSLLADPDHIKQHGFDHHQHDSNNLCMAGWLKRNEHDTERLVMHMQFYVGQGSIEFHEFDIPMSIEQMKGVVDLMDKFFE